MVKFIRSDLDFILEQIFIAEQNAAGMSMLDLLPNVQVPFGLRTVTGVNNNLVLSQDQFGAANNTFPRLLPPVFQTADLKPAGFFGPADPAGTTPTSYTQTSGLVFDSDPRTISNLIVDQTANNPAAVAAAAATPGSTIAISPGLDGVSARPTTAGRVHSERQAGLRPVGAVQRLVHLLRPVLRSRPRSRDQGRQRHRLHSAAARRSAVRGGQPDQLHGADAGHQSARSRRDRRHRRRHPRAAKTPRRRSSTRTRPIPRIPRTRCSCASTGSTPMAIRSRPAS